MRIPRRVTRAVTALSVSSVPTMVTSAVSESGRLSMHTAWPSPHERAGMRTLTPPVRAGVTVNSHVPDDCPGAWRDLVTAPPSTSNRRRAWARARRERRRTRPST